MKQVVFAMEWVPQYRAPFYDGVRTLLASEGINVSLIHGDPPPSRAARKDDSGLDWAETVTNRFFSIGGLELTWQPAWKRVASADLVILQQETGLLLNYPSLLASRLGKAKVGLWGHGHNFNPLEANAQAEWVKSKVTRYADWIFAYTEQSAQVFRTIGVDPNRITVVQNSTDTSWATESSGAVSADVAELLAQAQSHGSRVGWMVSALDSWKRIPFLIDVLDAIKAQRSDFEFFVLGSGTEFGLLKAASVSRPWLHVLGPRFGADKVAIGSVAELTIHPGLAGLHVVETFATGTPMITPDLTYHSHEVDYLADGVNALVLPAEVTAFDYATEVVGLFNDDDRLQELTANAKVSADRYSLSAMVERFAGGIQAALAGNKSAIGKSATGRGSS